MSENNNDFEQFNAGYFNCSKQETDDDCKGVSTDFPYRVIKKLGSGTSGVTFLVESLELKQKRALKIVHRKFNPREAELMASIDRGYLDNIVQIYDAGRHICKFRGKEAYAILMEFVDGPTLREVIDSNGKIDPKTVWGYSSQIYMAILCLKLHDIVHRDINPKNIKIKERKEGCPFGIVKIMDFGIATDEDAAEALDNPRYGVPSNMVVSDIFSLGMVTYEMATGEHLIQKKCEGEGSVTHQNRIKVLKEELYENKESRQIKKEYREKIINAVPNGIEGLVIGCLESDHWIDPRDLLCNTGQRLRINYEPWRTEFEGLYIDLSWKYRR